MSNDQTEHEKPSQEQILKWLDDKAQYWEAWGLGQSCKYAADEIRRLQGALDGEAVSQPQQDEARLVDFGNWLGEQWRFKTQAQFGQWPMEEWVKTFLASRQEKRDE